MSVNESVHRRLERLLRLRDRLNLKISEAVLKLEQDQNERHRSD